MTTLERHYRVSEIAELWSLSRDTVTRLFRIEPGVKHLPRGKRRALLIPESVLARVNDRLCNQPLKSPGSAGGPPRVIKLRDLH